MVEPVLPHWAQNVVNANEAIDLIFFMEKKIDNLDLSKNYNRFRFNEDAVQTKLIPYLTLEEMNKAWSISNELNVSVYVQGGWRVELKLRRKLNKKGNPKEFGKTDLVGNEMDLLHIFSNLQNGDNVTIWMFRRPDFIDADKKHVCFMLVKA